MIKTGLQYQINNGIGEIHFANPAGNSLSSEMLNQMKGAFSKLNEEPSVRVVVLSSGGDGAFCGGASLTELKAVKTLASAERFFMGFADLINAIRKLSCLVIAKVHGKTVGGGIGLVAACDYAIANEHAAIKLSELSIGLGPYVIEPAVSRKIGTTAFAQLSLEAHTWKPARWGLEKGLYATVAKDNLDHHVKTTAELFANYNPEAVKTLRQLHWKNTDHWEQLLPKNAKITGKLALSKTTKNIIESL